MKHSVFVRAMLAIVVGLPVSAQQSPAGAGNATGAKSTQVRTAKPKGLTVEGVASMVEAGLSEDVIITRLRKEGKSFDLSADDLIRLKKANVSDAILKVMMDPKAEVAAPSAQTPQPLPVPQPPPQTAVVQTPIAPGMATPQPSGATPGAGGSPSGDQNNPLVLHESGIYLYTKDPEGRAQMILLERAGYQGSKTGGILGSALTYGIKKTKTKAVIPGPQASVRVSDTSPIFYFYFEDRQAGLGKSNFGIANLTNPSQFALVKLEVKKSNRETVIGEYGAFSGMSTGTDTNAMVPFKSERIRTGLYKVVVAGLQVGEYCFLASSAAGAGAMTSADIFDFGVGN